MNEQQQYMDTRRMNTDPREQQQMMYKEPEYYASPERVYGEKLRPVQPQQKRQGSPFPFLVIGVVLLLFLIGSIGYATSRGSRSFGGYGKSAEETQVWKVTDQPTIIVNDKNGQVHIHANDRHNDFNVVRAEVSKQAKFGDGTDNIQVSYSFDKETNTITITTPDTNGSTSGTADIDISTPTNSNIQVSDDSGRVEIEGVSGNINATATDGSVSAHDINGKVTLLSSNGSIDVEHVTGQATITSGNGSIDVSGARLTGDSTLKSSNGTVTFEGTLEGTANYDFESSNGSVDVTLPEDASFTLNASTSFDKITNDFKSSTVGSGPQAKLTLRSGNGSVHLSKRG